MSSPEFKLDAFRQDIENLTSTLDRLDLAYNLVDRAVEVKAEGKPYENTVVQVPRFVVEQFLGRLCLLVEDLQLANATPENEGLIARCPEHGTEAEGAKFMYFHPEGRAFCLVCLCAQNSCEAGWTAPNDEDGEESVG